jgi:hypothetical protein
MGVNTRNPNFCKGEYFCGKGLTAFAERSLICPTSKIQAAPLRLALNHQTAKILRPTQPFARYSERVARS